MQMHLIRKNIGGNNKMEILNKYGLLHYLKKTEQQISEENIAKVISVSKTAYTLITGRGVISAELAGNLMHSLSKEDLPKVGDWVEYIDYDENGIINNILPRYSALYRKKAGKEFTKQVIATNIDSVFIVQGLDNDFNIMRLERYITQSLACGIKPIIILNKADLVENWQSYSQEIAKLQRDIEIYFCSALNKIGLDEIKKNLLRKEETYVFIGSSGVGKSSLLNALFDDYHQVTKEISSSTGKGKHTTTSRELFLLSNGSLVIDTPGMREFGVAFEEEDDYEEIFPVISEYAKDCKYSDCTHTSEDGCAVLEALERGDITTVKYESYLKLMREQAYFSESIQDKKRKSKELGKRIKEYKSYKKKNKI